MRRSELEGGEEGGICPRCGQPYRYVEKRKIGNNIYYYAVHYEGWERIPDGRARPKLRRCYLGPNAYIEVSKTHNNIGLILKGLIEEGREMDYINALAEAIEARLKDGKLKPEDALELAESLERLSELAKRLKDYATAGPKPEDVENKLKELLGELKELRH
jgi:hypothetical protein